MINRMISLSAKLVKLFQKLQTKEEAVQLFESIYSLCVTKIEPEILHISKIYGVEDIVRPVKITTCKNYEFLVEVLDDKYFSCEENGKDKLGYNYFTLARLISSISIAKKAINNIDYAEAAYEEIMACPNFQILVKDILNSLEKDGFI